MKPLAKEWCQRAIKSLAVKNVALLSLEDGNETPIGQWPTQGMDVDDLYTTIDNEAEGHVAGLGGLIRFRVVSRTEDNDVISSSTFALEGGLSMELVESRGSRGADEAGGVAAHLAQVYHHNEVLIRATIGGFAHLVQTNQDLRKEATTLRAANEQMRAALDQVVDRKHQREMEARQAEKDAEVKLTMVRNLAPLAYAALAKFIGPQAPQRQGNVELGARAFGATLTGEQIEAAINSGIFSQAQLTGLITLVEQMAKTVETKGEKDEKDSNAGNLIFEGIKAAVMNGMGGVNPLKSKLS